MRMSVFSHFMFWGFCLVLLPVFSCTAVIGLCNICLVLDLKSSVLNISHPSVFSCPCVSYTLLLASVPCAMSICSTGLYAVCLLIPIIQPQSLSCTFVLKTFCKPQTAAGLVLRACRGEDLDAGGRIFQQKVRFDVNKKIQ